MAGALAFLWLTLAQATPPAEGPAAELERAQELACSGRAVDARRAYERIVHDFPSSPEARVAERCTTPSALLGSCEIVTHGPSSNRVDVAILGDGYVLKHQRALAEVAEDALPLLERVEPFREYWSYFNFRRGVCVSADDGLDGFGREFDTLLGGFTYDTEEGHVGVDAKRTHDVLLGIPGNDGLAIVFVKQGVAGTGGDGLAVVGGRDARTVVHEWGHAFGGLGDEYATYTHERGPAASGINVSATDDEKRVPWRHWIEARHPSVGVYEGASGQAQNAWRPTASGCFMNEGSSIAFCPVCREALLLRIYSLVDPIESSEPPAPPPGVREPLPLIDRPLEITVRTMKPESHDLEVRWWVYEASRFPSTGGNGPRTSDSPVIRPMEKDRRQRGPLDPIPVDPIKEQRTGKDAEATLRLERDAFQPGLYRVTCRVRDTTELRGERFPWVLLDEHGVLESERVWWVEVR